MTEEELRAIEERCAELRTRWHTGVEVPLLASDVPALCAAVREAQHEAGLAVAIAKAAQDREAALTRKLADVERARDQARKDCTAACDLADRRMVVLEAELDAFRAADRGRL